MIPVYLLVALLMFAVVVLFFRRPFSPLATATAIGSILLMILGASVFDEQGWQLSGPGGLILLGAAVGGVCALAVQPRQRPAPRPMTLWTRGWHGLVGGIVAAALSLGAFFAMAAVALMGSGPEDLLADSSVVGVLFVTPFLLVLGVVFGFSYTPEDAQPRQDAPRARAGT
jgi:hypothetical protein